MLLRLWLILGLVWPMGWSADAEASEGVFATLPGAMLAKRRSKKRRRRRRARKRARQKVEKVPAAAVVAPAKPATKPKTAARKPKLAKGEAPGIAIKDLISVHGVPPGIATLLNDLILTRLKTSGRFGSVIGGSDMADMIDLEAQKQALGCDEESCLAELGGALGVPFMMAANLGKIGGQYLLTLKVISIDDANVVVRLVERAKSEDQLVDVVSKALDKAIVELLGADQKPKPPPAVAVTPVPAVKTDPLGSPASTGRPWLKWSGVAIGVGGAGWASFHAAQWSSAQQAFNARTIPYTTDVLDAFERDTEQANQALIQGLSAAGVGVVLAWWGW